MKEPGITIERMFKLVRKDVTLKSRKFQVPWESSSLIGDFYFVPQGKSTIVKRPMMKPETDVEEAADVAPLDTTFQKPDIIAYERRFEKIDSGIVYDKQNRLEWYAGPDKNLTWNQAQSWAEKLNVGGGGWRMPS